MSASMGIAIVVVVAVLALGYLIGRLLTLRQGMLRSAEAAANVDTSGLGLSETGPTVLHFSAPWCGPCTQVRRVVDAVCAADPRIGHVEIDMDANPEAARRLSVLSLPTTLVFDAGGHPRYRTSGVPTAADLRAVLAPLLDA